MSPERFANVASLVSTYLTRLPSGVTFGPFTQGSNAYREIAACVGISPEELREYVDEADRQLPTQSK